MEDLEQRLRLAVVAYVGGTRPAVSCQEATEALSVELRIPRHRFSVLKFHPEDFLVVFASPELRNKALAAGAVEHGYFKLFVKPWLKQAQAVSRVMRMQVDLMIEGIPSHAWTSETAAELLGSSCLVESLAPETENREDLSLFKVRAWCVDPDEVPADRRLWVPEPEMVGGPAARSPTSRALLEYKIMIHIGRVRDHEGPERWLRPPSSDGSGQSGLPEDSGDFSGRGEWRVLPWSRGVRDRRGGAQGNGAHGGSYMRALLGCIGPSDWRIPPMAQGSAARMHAPAITVVTTVATRVGEGGPLTAEVALVEPVATVDPGRMASATENPAAIVRDRAEQVAFDHGGALERGRANPEAQHLVRSVADPEASVPVDKAAEEARSPLAGGMDPVDPEAAAGSRGIEDLDPANQDASGGLEVAQEGTRAKEVDLQLLCPDKATDGWAPVRDLMQAQMATGEVERLVDSPVVGHVLQESMPTVACNDVTTYAACGERNLRVSASDLAACADGSLQLQEGNLSAKEIAALGNIKTFWAGLLKKLAPPLLREFEGLRGVRTGQDPFTPRRTTRSVCSGGARKPKASAAETVLLKTLGFDCEDLAVSEDALGQLRTVFDSPLQEPQLRAIAAIFGKAIPLNLAGEAGMEVPVTAQ
ncbi:hypothetical protein VPH35_031312 [Triticum aestivum]